MRSFILFLSFLFGCSRFSFGPSAWESQEQERKHAAQPALALTTEGKLPPAPTAAAAATTEGHPADKMYGTLCASCHGADGKSSTPMAASLNPKPRNLTDIAWQKKVTDEHIKTVIRDGGPAVGLSPLMAPWGSMLQGQALEDMVHKIRSFAETPTAS